MSHFNLLAVNKIGNYSFVHWVGIFEGQLWKTVDEISMEKREREKKFVAIFL